MWPSIIQSKAVTESNTTCTRRLDMKMSNGHAVTLCTFTLLTSVKIFASLMLIRTMPVTRTYVNNSRVLCFIAVTCTFTLQFQLWRGSVCFQHWLYLYSLLAVLPLYNVWSIGIVFGLFIRGATFQKLLLVSSK